jgi:regulator of cell morphogenesis and NO signaling
MTLPFSNTTTVRDIVNQIPKTSDVFKKYRIDFCCGGNTPLNTAAAQSSASLDELMQELAEAYEKNDQSDDMKIWLNSSSKEIIHHIIHHYHQPLREELSALSPYVTKIARVHGERHPELLQVHELFYQLKKELTEHTLKEEAESFPLILTLEKNPDEENRAEIIDTIKELEKEHDFAGTILKKLREITVDYHLPQDACGTYTLVFRRLEALESDTFMHVHLENNILFPRYF